MALSLDQLRGNLSPSFWRVVYWSYRTKNYETFGSYVTQTDAFEAVVRQQKVDRQALSTVAVEYYIIEYTMQAAHVSVDKVPPIPEPTLVLPDAAYKAMRK